MGLLTIGVISLTTDAEKLSATAYSGEYIKVLVPCHPWIPQRTDNYRSIQPRGRGEWCRRI
jgi:hypothetical protein